MSEVEGPDMLTQQSYGNSDYGSNCFMLSGGQKMEADKWRIADIVDLTDQEFKSLAELVYKRFGINLTDQKKALVMGRLNKVLRSHGFSNYSDYYNYLITDKTCESLLTFIDCISTNHSFFFRGIDHYDFLFRRALPDIERNLLNDDDKEIRIWSAGCSTGEEPYTIAMFLEEYFMARGRINTALLATDISRSVLDLARSGIYSKDRINGVPAYFLHKYFKMADKERVQIDERLKKNILFRRLNLMNETFPFKGKFHIIFCRNVMIYFDVPTRDSLVERFDKYLHHGGYLFIGHSESLNRKNCPFEFVQPAIYRKL